MASEFLSPASSSRLLAGVSGSMFQKRMWACGGLGAAAGLWARLAASGDETRAAIAQLQAAADAPKMY